MKIFKNIINFIEFKNKKEKKEKYVRSRAATWLQSQFDGAEDVLDINDRYSYLALSVAGFREDIETYKNCGEKLGLDLNWLGKSFNHPKSNDLYTILGLKLIEKSKPTLKVKCYCVHSSTYKLSTRYITPKTIIKNIKESPIIDREQFINDPDIELFNHVKH